MGPFEKLKCLQTFIITTRLVQLLLEGDNINKVTILTTIGGIQITCTVLLMLRSHWRHAAIK